MDDLKQASYDRGESSVLSVKREIVVSVESNNKYKNALKTTTGLATQM